MIVRLLALLVLLSGPVSASDVARVVYLGLENDPYYEPQPVYTGLSLRDRARPVEGLRLGFRDTRVLGRALGVEFQLEELLLTSGSSAAEAVSLADRHGALAIIADLPPDMLKDALDGVSDTSLLINIRERSSQWRRVDCEPQLLHSIPSDAMLSDALAQYLKARNWTEVLLLTGPTGRDADLAEEARRSARKFGLRISADRVFELTNDPRRREQSNIALLTGGVRHDVVWLIDSEGEFGRYVPFATYAARPVVGSEGLVARAWHWTFERYGAPQLNQRFRRLAGREMTSEDWAAWSAMRAIVEAVSQSRSVDLDVVHSALRSPDLSVDLYKGVRGNFRDWNGQLRQPIVLTTHNAVIGVAPVQGFEHRFDVLDTLGADRAEVTCAQ